MIIVKGKNLARGQSLELYFIDGKPDGMVTAQLFNWTGHVLMTPRTRLVEALKRSESSQTGVYVLLGEDEDGRQRAYIGESEDLRERLKNHEAKKDWWTTAVLVTAIGNALNKADVKYVESRLVEVAKRINVATLDNLNTPPRPSLSESSENNMEVFIDNLLEVLPAIRVDFLLERTRIEPPAVTQRQTLQVDGRFTLITPKHGIEAKARLQQGEFIVEAGSRGRMAWEGVAEHPYRRLFNEVAESGVTSPNGTHRVFNKDVAFASPSAAGAVLNGRATNGPNQWRVEGQPNVTYKQWEDAHLMQLG